MELHIDKNPLLFNRDCMDVMKEMPDNCVDFVMTDIPYDEVNRDSGGLRNLDKGNADIMTFDLHDFLHELIRITKNSMCVFCGRRQFSDIYIYIYISVIILTLVSGLHDQLFGKRQIHLQ